MLPYMKSLISAMVWIVILLNASCKQRVYHDTINPYYSVLYELEHDDSSSVFNPYNDTISINNSDGSTGRAKLYAELDTNCNIKSVLILDFIGIRSDLSDTVFYSDLADNIDNSRKNAKVFDFISTIRDSLINKNILMLSKKGNITCGLFDHAFYNVKWGN